MQAPPTPPPALTFSATTTADSRLFKLPGELRNRIYRYALLEDPVPIVDATFTEPGLLKTCKLIRHETASIYYNEADFQMTLVDNSSDLYMRWIRTAHALDIQLSAVVTLRPSRNWRNMATLVERFRTGQLSIRFPGPLDSSQLLTLEFAIVGGLFDTAMVCRALAPQAFASILTSQRAILGRHHVGWLVEHA